MHFEFSYVGLIYLVMLMVPNIIWTKNQPKDYEKYAVNENKMLLTFERIGEFFVSCAVLVFTDFNLKPWSSWSWWLIVSFVFMMLYEIYWIRYFLLAIYGKNYILGIAVGILCIGHIGIHLMHKKEISSYEE
jgi:hypothetical protein